MVEDTQAEALPLPAFQIVPVWGLPIVAVVIAGLLAAIASDRTWALNLFHVVGGALWTSIDLFVGLVIGPMLRHLSVRARMEFATQFMPKMVIIMPTLVTVTLASGGQLARAMGDFSAYPDWFLAAFSVVGVMAVIAIGILEPANLAVLFEMKNPQPTGELIGKLMSRFVWTAGITGMMQVAMLVIMTHIAVS
jgi:hypothetical protein